VNRFTVLYDACVLYPAPLRDLLLRLALTDLYRARWSEAIHEEWIRAVLRNRPDLSRQQLERTRSLMNAHVRDALVEGAVLTVLVVFLFLNSWRSTVITGLALPVSVLASFVAVWDAPKRALMPI
jgi:DNA-binding transcriptional regulator YbjK